MKHFWRTVRLALVYRWTLAGLGVSATMVGILWGANIATLQPFVEVAFHGRSMQEKIAQEIEDSQTKIAEFSRQIAALEPQLAAATEADDLDAIVRCEGNLSTARTKLRQALAEEYA